ncbi:cytoplasmic polyadenylation element-binding protein 1-like [Paramacrobiotus metropolitanus]|uniref:cytoplasmic polyadenylation element-binding protein 1-like n=1 Tax=Paramacrobiotus metropolitanus TaxID=2943436 RepID=UPI00244640F2|nr:cytoplasmic polyadenylation element-binding protein 1-like [Paramacrobiotus metropolitanus]
MFEDQSSLDGSQVGQESVLDTSCDYDAAFLSTGSNVSTFEPKRCSTPLSGSGPVSAASWTDYNAANEGIDGPTTRGYPRRGQYVPNLERAGQENLDCRRNSGNMRTIINQGALPRQSLRRLPVNASRSPTPTVLRSKAAMVPDYNLAQHGISYSPVSSPISRPVSVPMQNVTPALMHANYSHQSPEQIDHIAACSGRNSGYCGCASGGSPLMVEQYARVAGFRGGHKQHMMPKDQRWAGDANVERQAHAYRMAASIYDPTVVWSGMLPARIPKGSAYSCKVFLGGVPWDISEPNLTAAFGKYGPLKVEWPSNYHENPGRNSKGYLYIIFDNERSVRALLSNCTVDTSPTGGGRNYYYKVCSTRLRRKDVQIIPWPLSDSTYVHPGCISTSGTKTVFVGSLHGMLNAEGLARIMNDLFGGVVTANIDTDKYKYPIGSGRVVFNCAQSYVKAIRAAFVEIRTQKFSKKIQIDPFLEDSVCSVCASQMGPYFCRDMECFNYFCGTCWQWQHSDNLKHHNPMMRNPRSHDDEY